ncbi:MAG TPA: MFS transporter [Blastocatellia bacterium]|nr:MFS transporter [Blastocatellia bacterium]
MKSAQHKPGDNLDPQAHARPADTSSEGIRPAVASDGSSLFSWASEVSRYQWLVLLVAWLGWVFDSMDGTLYSLVQGPSMTELMGPGVSAEAVRFHSRVVLAVMLAGWAAGGIIFGTLADYIGRAKALAATVLIYSLFTGLSAASQTWEQLAAFRFITGLGLGGEWAAGAALVAEVWPDRLRAKAGAILQSAAAFGFFFAAVINLFVGVHSWRYVYIVGAAPAIFVLAIRLFVKEPDAWVEVRDARKRAKVARSAKDEIRKDDTGRDKTRGGVDETRGDVTKDHSFTLKQLFSAELRRDTLIASALAFVVLLALWGATVWIPAAVREMAARAGLGADEQTRYASYGVMLLNGGSLFGYLSFGPLADRVGRRAAFLFFFIGGLIVFPVTFLLMTTITQVFVLLPLVGFFTLGVTSGFPIYLPELFPTRVRTTGVGFCYNLGRIVTAGSVFLTGYLSALVGSEARTASAVSLVYILGMILLIFARETRGQRLA